jgi:hypothetical protein
MSFSLFRPEGLTTTLLDSLLSDGKHVVVVCQKDSVESEIENIVTRYTRAFPSKSVQGLGYICSSVVDINNLDKNAIQESGEIRWLDY